MPGEFILDTSALLDLGRAERHAHQEWGQNMLRHALAAAGTGPIAVTVFSLLELEAGEGRLDLSEDRRVKAAAYASSFEVIPFGPEAAVLAGKIHKKLSGTGARIGVVDTAVAATALHYGLTVVSSNPRQFERIAGLGHPLKVANWREG